MFWISGEWETGKISIFKTSAFSKILHRTLVIFVPSSTIDLPNKIQTEFLWDKKNAKIKHTTLCCDYTDSGLKSVDTFSKIVSWKCSWVKRLFDKKFSSMESDTPLSSEAVTEGVP